MPYTTRIMTQQCTFSREKMCGKMNYFIRDRNKSGTVFDILVNGTTTGMTFAMFDQRSLISNYHPIASYDEGRKLS